MGVRVETTRHQAGAEIVVLRPAGSQRAARRAQPLLSAGERRRAARFLRDADRFHYVEVCAERRLLLASRLGVPSEDVHIVAGNLGKPALAPGAPLDLRFNTSHSGNLAAIAFAVGREVGIDIEAVLPAPDLDRVAAQVLSEAERSTYLKLKSSDRLLAFYEVWTRKEAFTKALGRGLTCSLQAFDVSLGPEEPARILRVDTTPGERCGWHLSSFCPAPGFIGAVVIAGRPHGLAEAHP